jgi:hypothetical protein
MGREERRRYRIGTCQASWSARRRWCIFRSRRVGPAQSELDEPTFD